MKKIPILFNTEMVQAILNGRKTTTRRLIRRKRILNLLTSPYRMEHPEISEKQLVNALLAPPCAPGDYLYVRETWADDGEGGYFYRADEAPEGLCEQDDADVRGGRKWRPSILMPKKAVRTWLRVVSVQAEPLQSITEDGARREGIGEWYVGMGERGFAVKAHSPSYYETATGAFAALWNSVVKNEDKWWAAWRFNPWVWVIEFERCEKPEGEAS